MSLMNFEHINCTVSCSRVYPQISLMMSDMMSHDIMYVDYLCYLCFVIVFYSVLKKIFLFLLGKQTNRNTPCPGKGRHLCQMPTGFQNSFTADLAVNFWHNNN